MKLAQHLNNKGVSLAITIGLLLLLITLTATINLLVIRALRAAHLIEASDKSYFAAEAGIEDALYELSAHSAGYETPALGDLDVRSDDFTQAVRWQNEWEVLSKGLNECINEMDPTTWSSFTPTYCGRLYGNQKLVLNLFTDEAVSTGPGINEVGTNSAAISTLEISDITIHFRIPMSIYEAHSSDIFSTGLFIDNDNDGSLNEDSHADFGGSSSACPYSNNVAVDDDDCDTREDEDGREDPVFIWNIVDGSGKSLQQLRGCKSDPIHPSHPGSANAGLCEKNFADIGGELSVELSGGDLGVRENGSIQSVNAFLSSYTNSAEPLQFEILAVAPMAAVDNVTLERIPLPYYEYGISYNAGGDIIPSTFFSIRSDGYFRDFKQSITTNVVPRATTRLLDLTIIQQ